MENREKEFEKIVREHKSTIYTVCYMFSKDKEEVEDLFQEILMNLWKGYSSFKGESAISTWIWRASVNTCITADRKKKIRQTVPLSMSIDPFCETGEDYSQIRRLHSRINKLGMLDRAIILLWLENLSYEEIGSIIGISVKNVSVNLLRKTLATKLSGLQEYRNRCFIISAITIPALIYVWRMLNLSNWYLGYSILLIVFLMYIDFNIHKKLARYDIFNTNLSTILKELKYVKRRSLQSYCYSIPLVTLNIIWYLYEINIIKFKMIYIVTMAVAVIVGAFIAYLLDSRFFRMCDEIINDLDNL